MKRNASPTLPRALLLASLLLGAAAAQAASGYTVTRSQETQVSIGMTAAQVRQTLGHPESNVKYRNEPGRTYTYRVQGTEPTLFDVDFDAQGHVASVSERMDESGGGQMGHRQ